MKYAVAAVVMFATVTTTSATSPAVLFAVPRDYAVAAPFAIASGDFNGDSKPDLVVANRYSTSSITLMLSGGTALVAPVDQPAVGVVVADLNGDSHADIAVAGYQSAVIVLLGNGDGTLQPPRDFAAGLVLGPIRVADFNGDAIPDVVVARTDPAMDVLLGNGDGSLRAPIDIPLADAPMNLAVGDFNGDGAVDIAAGVGSSQIGLIPGRGDGTFLPAVYSPTGLSLVNGPSLVSGDFNGDGILDLVEDLDVYVTVFVGDGRGGFRISNSTAVDSYALYPTALAAGDFNGDGKLDVAAAAYSLNDAKAALLLGLGDGRLEAPVSIAVPGKPSAVTVADLNGDGRLDVAIAARNWYYPVGVVSLRFGNGDGTFAQTPALRTSYETDAVAAADFNGDGFADIATAPTNFAESYPAIILGNGNGTFRSSPAVWRIPGRAQAVAAADVDNDGHVDLVAVASGTTAAGVYVFRGRGDGSMAAPQFTAAGLGPGVMLLVDLNRDGKLDVVLVDRASPRVMTLLGRGDGTFDAPADVSAGANPSDVAAGDFDGDGIADLAIANADSNSVSITRGNGDGTFRAPTDTAVGTTPRWLTAADFNGDGRTDVAVSHEGSKEVRVLLSDGTGSFSSSVNYFAGGPPGRIRAVDLNGDGRPELAVLCGPTLAIFLGAADGSFRLQPVFFSTRGRPQQMAFGDFTADGRPDVVIGDYGAIDLLYSTTR